MTIINMTPHPVNLCDETGKCIRTIDPCGSLVRVATRTEVTGEIDGIPTTKQIFGEVEGLPEYDPSTIILVSSIVAQRVPERPDVFIPSDSVRDGQGHIIGCKSLAHV